MSAQGRCRWLGLLLVVLSAGVPALARAEAAETPQKVVSEAVQATQRGAFDEAVDRLELLADRGFIHPDASYARAYAYLQRARSRAAHTGDLGRAAAALEEYRALRSGDDDVDHALEVLRSEISRRRAREGSTPVVERPALGRAIADLLPENVWAVLTLLGTTLTSVGLALYLWMQRRTAEIAGATAIAAGLLFGVIGGALTLAARHYRAASRPAVVVVPEARLLDESGRAVTVRAPSPGAVPEGELVHVHEQREGRAKVEWGTINGWVDAAQLRFLSLPEGQHS